MEIYVKTLSGKSLTFRVDKPPDIILEVGRTYVIDARKWEVDDLKTVELLKRHGGDDWKLDKIREDGEYVFVSVLSKILYRTQTPHKFFNRLKEQV